jgi:hypothetical protein
MKDVRPSLHTGSVEGIAGSAQPSMLGRWVTLPIELLHRLRLIEQTPQTRWRYTSKRLRLLAFVPRLRIVSRALSHQACPIG